MSDLMWLLLDSGYLHRLCRGLLIIMLDFNKRRVLTSVVSYCTRDTTSLGTKSIHKLQDPSFSISI